MTNEFLDPERAPGSLATSGMLSQDGAEGELFALQNELASLKQQESALLLAIGREAYANNPNTWPQDTGLRLIQTSIAAIETSLEEAHAAQEQAEAASKFCTSCGAKLTVTARFCSECGTPQKV